jgi:hypothetical protein
MFRYYTNVVSQAGKKMAMGTLTIGLILIGFGVLILALPEVFAFLAAMVFFIAGLGFASTALKIFLANRQFKKMNDDPQDEYRENVRIHIEEKDNF